MSVVVVGIDGSEQSKRALRWALEEARLRGAGLRVVHAWMWASATFSGFAGPVISETIESMQKAAVELVGGLVTEVVGPDPDVEIETLVVEGAAAPSLIEAARDAEVLVVGSRGHGGFAGLLLGSVSQQCAHHATCPVVIVPRAKADQGRH
jgi:nucleotide-binding universal stress UspA family protein